MTDIAQLGRVRDDRVVVDLAWLQLVAATVHPLICSRGSHLDPPGTGRHDDACPVPILEDRQRRLAQLAPAVAHGVDPDCAAGKHDHPNAAACTCPCHRRTFARALEVPSSSSADDVRILERLAVTVLEGDATEAAHKLEHPGTVTRVPLGNGTDRVTVTFRGRPL